MAAVCWLAVRPCRPYPPAHRPANDVPRHHICSGDRIRTCDLWVMSYAPGVFRCSRGLKSAGQSRSGVPSLPPCRAHSRRFCGVLFPNLFPNLAGVPTIADCLGAAARPLVCKSQPDRPRRSRRFHSVFKSPVQLVFVSVLSIASRPVAARLGTLLAQRGFVVAPIRSC